MWAFKESVPTNSLSETFSLQQTLYIIGRRKLCCQLQILSMTNTEVTLKTYPDLSIQLQSYFHGEEEVGKQ